MDRHCEGELTVLLYGTGHFIEKRCGNRDFYSVKGRRGEAEQIVILAVLLTGHHKKTNPGAARSFDPLA